jgi:hypothetical protein
VVTTQQRVYVVALLMSLWQPPCCYALLQYSCETQTPGSCRVINRMTGVGTRKDQISSLLVANNFIYAGELLVVLFSS